MLKIEKGKKACICAVNASYTHTSLALLCLKAACADLDVTTKEYSINDTAERVCGELYLLDCDVYLFGCYIWNLPFLEQVTSRLKAVKPECSIVFGGPEVSYDTESFMQMHPYVDLCVRGEGDESVPALLRGALFSEIDGLCYRESGIVIKSPACVKNLDKLPRIYDAKQLESMRHKMLYYETSRGCPFRCSYCLSSTSHGVRYFDLERVKADFKLFMDENVPLVKLTDRTFNTDAKRTAELLEFILKNNKNTCFHFEVSADILDEKTLALLETAPKGMFQLEIGVQTTNPQTSAAIDRSANFEKIQANVLRLKRGGNMHLHLDLIAGLPYEDYDSFKCSFNDVFALRPDMLQLGFLKLLKGTKIRAQAEAYGYVSTKEPPYEVLESKWLPYDKMLQLKRIEYVLDLYYSSGAYSTALEYSLKLSGLSAFAYFEALAEYIRQNTLPGAVIGQSKRYEMLYEFHTSRVVADDGLFNAYLRYEQIKNNKTAQLGAWAKPCAATKAFYDAAWQSVRASGCLTEKQLAMPHKDMIQYVRIVRFDYDMLTGKKQDTVVVFDYENKNTYSLAVVENEENNLR